MIQTGKSAERIILLLRVNISLDVACHILGFRFCLNLVVVNKITSTETGSEKCY